MIWRGMGILVLVITVVMLVILQGITGVVFGDPRYSVTHTWVVGAACILSAIAVHFLGRHLNNRAGRIVIEKSTGREFELKKKHDLFFIRMEYWAIPLAVGGLFLLFQK
jgi:hypothetical protein